MHNRRNGVIARRPASPLLICGGLLAVCVGSGCIELGILTPAGPRTETPTADGNAPTPGTADAPVPTAALTASNFTPQLSEEVTLTCRVATGDNTGALFSFDASQDPATGLNINRSSGRATFIVTESDLNSSFRFTCSVMTDAGQSAASSAQLITPTGP